jgi:hypothetical protein
VALPEPCTPWAVHAEGGALTLMVKRTGMTPGPGGLSNSHRLTSKSGGSRCLQSAMAVCIKGSRCGGKEAVHGRDWAAV